MGYRETNEALATLETVARTNLMGEKLVFNVGESVPVSPGEVPSCSATALTI